MEIRVEEPQVVLMGAKRVPVILLKEQDGRRTLTISLSEASLDLLIWVINGQKIVDHQIFQFLSEFTDALKATIDKVVLTDTKEISNDMFYSCRVFIGDTREDMIYSLPLHVTHALILALAVKCPVFVDEEVFKKVEEYNSPSLDKKFQKMLDDIDPDKMTKN